MGKGFWTQSTNPIVPVGSLEPTCGFTSCLPESTHGCWPWRNMWDKWLILAKCNIGKWSQKGNCLLCCTIFKYYNDDSFVWYIADFGLSHWGRAIKCVLFLNKNKQPCYPIHYQPNRIRDIHHTWPSVKCGELVCARYTSWIATISM